MEGENVPHDPQDVAAPFSWRHVMLDLVREEDRAHAVGGRVTVESSPGTGARMVASLPLADR